MNHDKFLTKSDFKLNLRSLTVSSEDQSKGKNAGNKKDVIKVSRSVNNIPADRADDSFVIHTQTTEFSICPDCLNEVEQKKMKIHQLQFCENRIILCPSLGCGKHIHQKNLPFHLREECVVALNRKNLLASAAERALLKADLDAQILESYKHQRNSVLLDKNLFEAMEKEESKVSEPKVLICAQCGEGIRESHLPHHMQNTCHFRPVSCPNMSVGCHEASIPLNNIHIHLLYDCIVEKRKEDMIVNSKKRKEYIKCSTCGYQVELRLWKRHERELCENRLVPCKNHPLGCSVMIPSNERELHENIDESYERFCLYFPGHGSFLQIEESDLICPWTSEYWIYRPLPQDSLRVHLRNLFSLVSSYEVAYVSEYLARNKVMKIVNALKDDALVTKPASRDGKKLSKSERQRIQQEQMQIKVNLINDLTSLIPVYSDAVLAFIRAFQQIAICIEASFDCLKELAVSNHDAWDQESDLSLQTEYPGGVGTVSGPKTSFGESKGQKSGNTTARSILSEEEIQQISTARTNSTMSDIDDGTFAPEALRLKVDQSPVAKSILECGQSILSRYYRFCYLCLICPHNGGQTKSNGKSTGNSTHRFPGEDFVLSAEKRQLEDRFVKLFGHTQLPDSSICQFLIGFLLEPVTTMKRLSFHPKLWKKLLDHLATLLKLDFDDLQDWRIEAGLIAPDASAAATKAKLSRSASEMKDMSVAATPGSPSQSGKEDSDEVEDEKEKKRKKKEKERQRRELKKLQSKKVLADEGDTATASVSNQSDEAVEGAQAKQEVKDSPENGERRLIVRITELLKSGCGCEILNDSSSVNELHHRSHFCLAMYSGLSLLMEKEEDETSNMFSSVVKPEKDHHYELLISPKDMAKLLDMQGQLGFVKASECDTSSLSEQELLLRQLLGTQAHKTDIKVSRGKWSHISFVSTKKPQNRTLVYLEGSLVGNFKDSAFSLPMLSLGGSPLNIFSFSGLLLDARYWTHVRSGRQIQEKMHSLIALSMNKITNSAATQLLQSITTQQPSGNELSRQSHLAEDYGLIAWWTMDDGPGFDITTDVTRHRFKTRIINRTDVNYLWNGLEESRYEIPSLISAELPDSMLQLRSYLASMLTVKRKARSGRRVKTVVINESVQVMEPTPRHIDASDPTSRQESFRQDFPTTNFSEVATDESKQGDMQVADSMRLNFDDLFVNSNENNDIEHEVFDTERQTSRSPSPVIRTSGPNGRLIPQSLLKYVTQYKWIKAESVKTLVSLLAYEIPKTPKAAKELSRQGSKKQIEEGYDFQDERSSSHDRSINSKKKSRKVNAVKKSKKGEHEKPKKLPYYLLEESLTRSKEGSDESALENILPIPSFRDQNICPFELRRHRLARYGRELQKYVICPLNCSQTVKKIAVRFHVRFECERRYVTCYYEGCNMIFPLNERENHERNECFISKQRSLLLQEAEEKNQKIICSLCSEEVALRHYEMHQRSECSHRMIFCTNDDCSFGANPRNQQTEDPKGSVPRLPAHLLEQHLRFDCDSLNIKNRCILIDRSRSRNPYPRPWGLVVSEKE